jgi:hypothetical protein
MVESSFPTDRPAELVCPWCSAPVTQETAVCASCHAILHSGDERELPGVTAVDQSVVRGEKKAASRSRLLSWISGDYVDEPPTVSEAHALAPPDPEVQREMLRLELEAELANLQAEAEAIRAEAIVEGREAELPEGYGSFTSAEDAAETPAAEAGSDAPAAEAGSDAPAAEAHDVTPTDVQTTPADVETPPV